MRFELVLGILHNSREVTGQRALLIEERRVWEENVGFSGREWTLNHGHNLVSWSLQKLLSDRYLPLLISHVRIIRLYGRDLALRARL